MKLCANPKCGQVIKRQYPNCRCKLEMSIAQRMQIKKHLGGPYCQWCWLGWQNSKEGKEYLKGMGIKG